MTVDVPLMPGSPRCPGALRTRDLAGRPRVALVGLERGQPRCRGRRVSRAAKRWSSKLPADAARAEVWSFVVSPQWNIVFEGMPAVLPASINSSTWIYEFHPRPGEKLRAHITRPERAAGSTLAIDSVRPVRRSSASAPSTTTLEFQYRSTQGGRHCDHAAEDRAGDGGAPRRTVRAGPPGRRGALDRPAARRSHGERRVGDPERRELPRASRRRGSARQRSNVQTTVSLARGSLAAVRASAPASVRRCSTGRSSSCSSWYGAAAGAMEAFAAAHARVAAAWGWPLDAVVVRAGARGAAGCSRWTGASGGQRPLPRRRRRC